MVLANILVFKKTLCAHFTLRYIFNRIKCLLFCVDFYSLYILFGHINFRATIVKWGEQLRAVRPHRFVINLPLAFAASALVAQGSDALRDALALLPQKCALHILARAFATLYGFGFVLHVYFYLWSVWSHAALCCLEYIAMSFVNYLVLKFEGAVEALVWCLRHCLVVTFTYIDGCW